MGPRHARSVLVWSLLIALFASGPAADAAANAASTYTPGDKLGRGVVNLVTGFLEIPRNIHVTTTSDGLLAGWTVGVGKGLGYTVLRMGVGVYEILTFPFAWPKGYRPIVEPAYVWQAPGPSL